MSTPTSNVVTSLARRLAGSVCIEVNGDSRITGKRSLDSLFKERMFIGVGMAS